MSFGSWSASGSEEICDLFAKCMRLMRPDFVNGDGESPFGSLQYVVSDVDNCRGLDSTEANWDQKASATIHTKNSNSPLNSSKRPLFLTLQRSTNKIVKWASETGFTISAEKMKTLLVHRRRPRVLPRPSLKISMGERMLEMVRHHRILGLILDEKLNWKEHLKNVKARTSKKLNLLKTLAHKEWGGRHLKQR
jgi:hypothetical protein